MKLEIEKIANWGPGETVSTGQGPRWLRSATPTEEFWALWGRDKEALKSAGITVRKLGDGTWQVCWWAEPPAEPATATVAKAAPRGNGLLLAHEMGLGKTICAIAAINRAAGDPDAPDGLSLLPYQLDTVEFCERRFGRPDGDLGPILVICPASLRINWAREMAKWFTRARTIQIIATGKDKFDATADVIICNYDLLAKYHADLRSRTWAWLIVDEAHYLKNPKALRTKQTLGKWHRDKAKSIAPLLARKRLFELFGNSVMVEDRLSFRVEFHFFLRPWRHLCDQRLYALIGCAVVD